MKNPFSYRNRLAADLKKQRKAIDAWTSEKTREDLLQELANTRTNIAYIKSEFQHINKRPVTLSKSRTKQRIHMDRFEAELMQGEDKISFLNKEMAEKVIAELNWRMQYTNASHPPFLSLYGLREITPEAAWALAQYPSEIFIPWKALKNNPRTLKNLWEHSHNITFLRTKEISPLMAQQIKNGNFPSEFRDIQHISPESAEIIGQNQSPITLRFDGSNIPDNIEEILTILAKHDHNKNKITILPAYYENMFQRIKERTLA